MIPKTAPLRIAALIFLMTVAHGLAGANTKALALHVYTKHVDWYSYKSPDALNAGVTRHAMTYATDSDGELLAEMLISCTDDTVALLVKIHTRTLMTQSSVQLRIDDGPLQNYQYTQSGRTYSLAIKHASASRAQLNVYRQLIQLMRAGRNIHLQLIDTNSDPWTINFSLAGFTRASSLACTGYL